MHYIQLKMPGVIKLTVYNPDHHEHDALQLNKFMASKLISCK